jgi:uncharacterized protein
MHTNATIGLYSGGTIDILNPRAEDVRIEDIAHALSQQCRFTGHTRSFYSVAQHCVLASRFVEGPHQLWALLHDSPEAYMSDLNRPLKHTPEMSRFRTAEKAMMAVIVQTFSLNPLQEPAEVKAIDRRLVVTEARDLLPRSHSEGWEDFVDVVPLPMTIVPWVPVNAKRRFLERFEELTGSRQLAVIRG